MSYRNPSYSLDPDGNPPYVTLPGAYRFGGRRGNREDTNISLETDAGYKYVYNLASRLVFELHWRLMASQVQPFTDLNMAVAGEVFPFWFSISGSGLAPTDPNSDSIYVRKEPGFDPIELDTPGNSDSVYDYVMHLTEDFTQIVGGATVVLGPPTYGN